MEIAEDDQRIERIITKSIFESNSEYRRDDTFSQRGSKSKKGSVIIKEGMFPANDDPIEEMYTLSSSTTL